MPFSNKTPIPDLGDSGPVDETAAAAKFGVASSGFGAAPAGFGAAPAASGFGAAPAAAGFGSAAPMQSAPAVPQPVLTAAGSNAAEGAEVLVKTDDKFGNFVNSKWRPLMAFMYMITCACDFVIFPVLWSILQAIHGGQVTSQWQPLTLQGAGLYHLAMGAVLGVAAYGRTKEKVAGAA